MCNALAVCLCLAVRHAPRLNTLFSYGVSHFANSQCPPKNLRAYSAYRMSIDSAAMPDTPTSSTSILSLVIPALFSVLLASPNECSLTPHRRTLSLRAWLSVLHRIAYICRSEFLRSASTDATTLHSIVNCRCPRELKHEAPRDRPSLALNSTIVHPYHIA